MCEILTYLRISSIMVFVNMSVIPHINCGEKIPDINAKHVTFQKPMASYFQSRQRRWQNYLINTKH